MFLYISALIVRFKKIDQQFCDEKLLGKHEVSPYAESIKQKYEDVN